MKSLIVKFSTSTKEVKKVRVPAEGENESERRIDEEGLFNLFTANIMKLKKRFVR